MVAPTGISVFFIRPDQFSYSSSQVIDLGSNRGKGYACRTGLKKVTGDIVIIQDADLEYDPNDYFKLIQPIKSGGNLGETFSFVNLFSFQYH